MKIVADCRYNGLSERIEIEIGEGRQNLKWLGAVASQRFVDIAKTNGRRRRRERHIFKGPWKAKIKPSRVYTVNEPFCAPDNILADTLIDGALVYVDLKDVVPIDLVGIPIVDRWNFVSFNNSPHMALRRKDVLDEEMRIQESMYLVKKRERDKIENAIWKEKAMQMRCLAKFHLYSSEKIDSAFNKDWEKMNRSISHSIDKIIVDSDDMNSVKHILRANYITVSELFMTYSSAGSGVRTDDMDPMEFGIFMHDLKIFPPNKNREIMERMFQECCNNNAGIGLVNASMGMELHNFLLVLVKLAILKYVRMDDSVKSYVGMDTGSNGSSAAVHVALKQFMDQFIVPEQEKLFGLQVKRAFETDKFLALFFDHHEDIWSVFCKFSKPMSNGSSTTENLLDINGFGEIFEKANLLGGKSKLEDELTIKETRQAFAGAQQMLCGEEKIENLAHELPEKHQDLITYGEFLEGIARVATLKWEDTSIPLYDKVKWSVEFVGELNNDIELCP